jgi:hypothetical protein
MACDTISCRSVARRMILKGLARAQGQPNKSIAPEPGESRSIPHLGGRVLALIALWIPLAFLVFSPPLITILQTFSIHEIGAHTICLTPAVASEGRLYLNHHRPRSDQPKNAQFEEIANDMLFNHVRSPSYASYAR